MPGPEVSVVLPVRDGEAHVGQAVDSILSQTLADLELVVVDDGSEDRTPDVLAERAGDRRLRILPSEGRRGLVAALNHGVAAAAAPLIARMDADDVAHPDRLARQVEHLARHPDVGLVGTSYRQVHPDGRQGSLVRLQGTDAELRYRLAFRNPFAHPTVVFRRAWFDAAGGYAEAAVPAEDYDLFARFAAHGRLAVLPDVLLSYRLSADGVTATRPEGQRERAAAVSRAYVVALAGREVEGAVLDAVRDGRFRDCDELAAACEVLVAVRRAVERRAGADARSRLRREVRRDLLRFDFRHAAGERPCRRCRARAVALEPRLLRSALALGRA